MKKRSKLHNIMLNTGIILVSVIIALLLGEVVIRLLFKDEIVLFPRYHTDAQYGDFRLRKVRPGMKYMHRSIDGNFSFTSNNHGFRNERDIDYEKGDDEIRVLCLGDSHTLGYEVNQGETFSSQMQTSLREEGINATVINAGVSGFSTAEELVLLENEGYKFKPDFVVVGFFANDFYDNMRSNLFALSGNSLEVINHEYVPGVNIQNVIYRYKLFHWLGENSYLYAFSFNAAWGLFKEISAQSAAKDQEVAVVTEDEQFSPSEKALMKALISQIYGFCKANGMSLIIVDIPTHELYSSIPDDMVPFFRENCDTLLYYYDLKPMYDELNLTHVPHGHRHISSEAHKLMGDKVAGIVNGYLEEESLSSSYTESQQ